MIADGAPMCKRNWMRWIGTWSQSSPRGIQVQRQATTSNENRRISALDPTAACSTAAQGRRGQRPSRLWFYGTGVELGSQWHFSPPAAVARDLCANQRYCCRPARREQAKEGLVSGSHSGQGPATLKVDDLLPRCRLSRSPISHFPFPTFLPFSES